MRRQIIFSILFPVLMMLISCEEDSSKKMPNIERNFLTIHIKDKNVDAVVDDKGIWYKHFTLSLGSKSLNEDGFIRLLADYEVENKDGKKSINVHNSVVLPLTSVISEKKANELVSKGVKNSEDYKLCCIWSGYMFLNFELFIKHSNKPCDVFLVEEKEESLDDEYVVNLRIFVDKKENKDFYDNRYPFSFPILNYIEKAKAENKKLTLKLKAKSDKGNKEYSFTYE